MDHVLDLIRTRQFKEASEKLNDLISEKGLNEQPQVLLCRAICLLEISQLESCKQDLDKILSLPDFKSQDELIPGCFSTRMAAATMLAKVYKKLGDSAKEAEYLKLATEIGKNLFTDMEKATQIKELGNKLYKQRKIQEALGVYKEAMSLDPTNVSIISNACQMHLLLGNIKEADELASRCVDMDPEWVKSWYRRAMVSIKMQKYTDALYAIQKGLALEPENEDLKKLYSQASRLAEKTETPANIDFNKKLLGIMAQLQYRSWVGVSIGLSTLISWQKVKDWLEENAYKIKHFQKDVGSFSNWWLQSSKAALNSSDFDRLSMRLQKLYPFDTNSSLIFQDDPLLTLALARKVLELSDFTVDDWSFIWTFQADLQGSGHPFTESVHGNELQPGHRTYCFLVSREENLVVDIFSLNGKKWARPIVPFLQDLLKKAPVIYTCDDEAEFLEFLDAMYVMRRPKFGDLIQPAIDSKKPDEQKKKLKSTEAVKPKKDKQNSTEAVKPKAAVIPTSATIKSSSTAKRPHLIQEYAIPFSAIALVLVSVLYYFI